MSPVYLFGCTGSFQEQLPLEVNNYYRHLKEYSTENIWICKSNFLTSPLNTEREAERWRDMKSCGRCCFEKFL